MKYVVRYGAVAMLLAACDGGGGSTSDTRTTPGETSEAPYAESPVEVCDVLPDDATSVSLAVAENDNQQLGAQLVSADVNAVRTVGLSKCGDTYVVVVGVSSSSVKVPGRGAGGTPVISHPQLPIFGN